MKSVFKIAERLFDPVFLRKGLFVVSGIVLIAFLSGLRIFSFQELFFYDLAFRLRGPEPVSQEIVLIDIDDQTLQSLGSWPLPRNFHASLVEAISSFEPKAIVFDLLFSEPSADDLRLAESFKRAGCVYLATAYYFQRDVLPSQKVPLVSETLAGVAPLLRAGVRGFGHVNVSVDHDGKVRRVPILLQNKEERVPNLGVAVVEGISGKRLIFDQRAGFHFGSERLPVTEKGRLLVNYPGSWAGTFRHISYLAVLKAYRDMKLGNLPGLDLSILRGKICLVGLTATGTSDLRATPLENVYPMVGLQASVMNSFLTGRFVSQASALSNALVGIVIFFLALLICLNFSPVLALAVNLVLGVCWGACSLGLFVRKGVWFDLFLPLAVIAAVYGGFLFSRLLQEVRRRQILEKELEIAERIQKSFLPKIPSGLKGLSVEAYLKPAKFVGGDFYDFVRINESKLGILIGDVCGKGVPASLIMAQTVSLFRILSRGSLRAADVLTAMNAELSDMLQGRFVTAFYMIIDVDAKILSYSSAGHEAPIVFSKALSKLTGAQGPALGLEKGHVYGDASESFVSGEDILLYTDGLTEARDRRGREFGEERMIRVAMDLLRGQQAFFLNTFCQEIVNHQKGKPLHDDITAILVRFGE